ncbi:5' nucleotidase, NT5C type [Rhodocytophaga rosea]|nr:5'(3')-deoxyribonucleotidase [Rhodocytophaga rosea]
MTMKRIAIDMDEVIADANLRFMDWYERDFGRRITLQEIHGKFFREVVSPEHREHTIKYLHTEGFFKDMAVIKDSQEVVYELSKKYEIFITTAAMEFPTSFIHKYEWLKQHFPFIPWTHMVFCGDKSIIHADYLIDDHSRHFKRFSGQGILFTSPHNVHEDWNPRVNSWKDVADLLL